ncbi:hypothetical protein [Parasediminibacterium sp. JCM 36343]|uniref:hypothetical protein n=1 Tax=Parasediminibacterium sp. JCM 36343 TaxID=3374279 RepID=UPI00397A5CF1
MRKIIAYLVLMAYSATVTMPVLPYFTDFLAHTFWLYQHISTVHYEHGQYHTHYQSIEIQKKADPEKGTAQGKFPSSSNEHIVLGVDYNSPHIHFYTIEKPLDNFSVFIPHSNLFTDYPPPKA